MIGIIVLSIPILCLLFSIVYCIMCIRKASRETIPARNSKRNDNIQKEDQKNYGWIIYDLLLEGYTLLVFIASSVVEYISYSSEQRLISVYSINSILLYALFVVIYFLSCKTRLIEELHKVDAIKMIFSKKSSIVAFSFFSFSVAVFVIYKRFFSNIVFELTFSLDNFFQISFGTVSFLLIGSALWTCAQKMLTYIRK